MESSLVHFELGCPLDIMQLSSTVHLMATIGEPASSPLKGLNYSFEAASPVGCCGS